jgi:predicted NACHT family NTPase
LKPTDKTDLLAKYTKISEQEIQQFLKGYPINKNVFIKLCLKLEINTKKILDIGFLKFLVLSVPKISSKRSTKIQDQCGTLQILDVSRPIDLDDLYVDVNILKEPNSDISLELDDLPKVYDSETDEFNRFCIGNVRQPRISGLEVILNYSKLMVLGKPGAGKSTFLH